MNSLMAALISGIIGYLISDVLDNFMSFTPSAIISFVLSTIAFYFVRNWLKRIKGE